MRNDPAPVAQTAAMLMQRAGRLKMNRFEDSHTPWLLSPYTAAALATDLHRLAKACHRQAEHECNGRQFDGQSPAVAIVALEAADTRLVRRLEKLNARLAPLKVKAHRTGDPRGFCLHLTAIDGSPALPTNGMQETWGIA